MKYSRRDLALLLSAAAASAVAAQQEPSKRLPSKAIKFEDMPVRATGANKTRAILDGETHSGFPVEIHETERAAGGSPHAPHKHIHEEMFLIQDGLQDV